MSAAYMVRTYKSLGQVEQAFRCLKGVDLRVRPIRHRSIPSVRAHVFLCLLSQYVEWHTRKALAPILLQDEELDSARWQRDPVARAEPSEYTRIEKSMKRSADDWSVHGLRTLIAEMCNRCKNRCRIGDRKNAHRFDLLTEPTDFQKHVVKLLAFGPSCDVPGEIANKIPFNQLSAKGLTKPAHDSGLEKCRLTPLILEEGQIKVVE